MIQGLITDMVSRKPNGQKEVSEEVEMESNEPEDESGEGIPDQIKRDWNDFLGYLDKKGVKGKPELDKGGLGNKYFQEYLKENPKTSLNEAVIPKIRQAYMKLREENLENIKTGKIGYKGTPESFMKHIVLNEQSANPNYVGQHLTQTLFPGYEIKDEKTGETLRAEQIYKSAKSVLKGKPQMQ